MSEQKKKGFPKFILVILLFLFIFLGLNSLVTTYPNEYKVIKQFGGVVNVTKEPGLSFKIPFIQTEQTIDKSLRLTDLPASDVITKDKKTMIVDCFALWRVVDPEKYIQSLNADDNNASSRISIIVYNALKNVISSLDQTAVISGRDGELANEIINTIGNDAKSYGIEITSVETKMLDLPDANKQAVYERMISERNNIAAQYAAEGQAEAKKIRNETDAKVTVLLSEAKAQKETLLAEGEAEYMRIISEAYDSEDKADFYEFILSLDAVKNSLKDSKDNVLILDKNSPIAKVLLQGAN